MVFGGLDSVMLATAWCESGAGGIGCWVCDRSRKVVIDFARSKIVLI